MPIPPEYSSLEASSRVVAPARALLRRGLLMLGLLAVFLPGLAYAANPVQAKLNIGVSISPQAFFLAAIGGEHLQVTVLLGSGQDPHTFSPNSAQMVALGEAVAFFPAGLDIERHWLHKIHSMFPAIEWVVDKQLKPDGHFWLAPQAVMQHVKLMRDALLRLDPANAATYRQNTAQFLQQLHNLDEQFITLFKDIGERNRFMVQHAAWDTFAADYGLEQLVIEEEGKAAGIKHLARIISTARKLQIDTVFADTSHSSKVALGVARQANASVTMLNTVSANWRDDLVQAATSIRAALK